MQEVVYFCVSHQLQDFIQNMGEIFR